MPTSNLLARILAMPLTKRHADNVRGPMPAHTELLASPPSIVSTKDALRYLASNRVSLPTDYADRDERLGNTGLPLDELQF